jgi:hypothetical protein
MRDKCLEQFRIEWDNAQLLVVKAVVLYNWVHYVKLRYRAVNKLAEEIGPKLTYLEDHVQESSGKDFLKIQRVVADGRRTISDCSNRYGSGFKRKPSARTRAKLAQTYPGILLFPGQDPLAPADPDTDLDDDLLDRDLGHGSA